MLRRRFASALALGIGVAPLAGRGQTAVRTARVGVLSSAGAPLLVDAELQKTPWSLELGRLGWIEGQNLVFGARG